MICPNCHGPTIATRIKYKDDGDEREHRCLDCNLTFWMTEHITSVSEHQAFQAALFRIVTEANGSRQQAVDLIANNQETTHHDLR